MAYMDVAPSGPANGVPVLIMAGSRDRTAPGKAYAKPADKEKFGHVLARAQALAPTMKNARVEASTPAT
jgi:hypothetical protein